MSFRPHWNFMSHIKTFYWSPTQHARAQTFRYLYVSIYCFQWPKWQILHCFNFTFQQHEGPWKVALLLLARMVKVCFEIVEKNLGHTFNFIKVVCQSSWKNSCNLFIFYRTIKLLTLLFWRNNHATLGSARPAQCQRFQKITVFIENLWSDCPLTWSFAFFAISDNLWSQSFTYKGG